MTEVHLMWLAAGAGGLLFGYGMGAVIEMIYKWKWRAG